LYKKKSKGEKQQIYLKSILTGEYEEEENNEKDDDVEFIRLQHSETTKREIKRMITKTHSYIKENGDDHFHDTQHHTLLSVADAEKQIQQNVEINVEDVDFSDVSVSDSSQDDEKVDDSDNEDDFMNEDEESDNEEEKEQQEAEAKLLTYKRRSRINEFDIHKQMKMKKVIMKKKKNNKKQKQNY